MPECSSSEEKLASKKLGAKLTRLFVKSKMLGFKLRVKKPKGADFEGKTCAEVH